MIITQILAETNIPPEMFVLLLPILAGGGFFYAKYRKYRNKDKHYKYEHETSVNVTDMKQYDEKLKRIHDVSNSKISKDNSKKHRVRVTRVMKKNTESADTA